MNYKFYRMKKNVPWHILAPSAVACDMFLLRASAHPRGAFFFIGRNFLRNKKADCREVVGACKGLGNGIYRIRLMLYAACGISCGKQVGRYDNNELCIHRGFRPAEKQDKYNTAWRRLSKEVAGDGRPDG